MNNALNPNEGILLLAAFGLTMLLLVIFFKKSESNISSFLQAGKNVGKWQGALSIAVSWVWAPAIFICSLQSYTKGIPGIFWFTLPQYSLLFSFCSFCYSPRKEMPEGYTFSQFIRKKYPNDNAIHQAFI